MMNPVMNMPGTWGTMGSTLLTVIFFWDMLRRYCPPELRRYLEKCSIRVSQFLNPYVQISIHEYLGSHLRPHEAYSIVEAYLSLNSSKHAKRLKAEMTNDNDSKLMLSMDEYEKTTDEFNGVQVKWISGKSCNTPTAHVFILPGAREEVLQAQVPQTVQGDDNGDVSGACHQERERDSGKKQAEEAVHKWAQQVVLEPYCV
ncbi:UNVERIFIED_CONTAM: AAA-ATPase ASD, mitochondrial [Sesamum calycinum]|uniref:AAA-ATPase ASD, mitochondrial n=1 Tax=Sesamum calycinum TaxID=2727403 RepID=A0AAW2PRB9_9LAMI